MKVVVTGAAGFIGSHLADALLDDGHEVTGVDAFTDYYARATKERNLEKSRDHRAFRLVEGRLQDLDLRSLLDGVGQVYHLAAQAGVRASWGREFAHYTDHNVLATQRLLEAARPAGGPGVVYASSSAAFPRSFAFTASVTPRTIVTAMIAQTMTLKFSCTHGMFPSR